MRTVPGTKKGKYYVCLSNASRHALTETKNVAVTGS